MNAPNVNELLNRMVDIKGAKEELNKRLSELSSEEDTIEQALIHWYGTSGLKSVSNDFATVSFDPDAIRVRYDPEKWSDIVKWAVTSDNLHIIQRRLTDAKILSLVTEGTALPDGLTLDNYTKVSFRRK